MKKAFLGSCNEANPIKSFKWVSKPKPKPNTIENLKLIRASVEIPNSRGLDPIELTRAMRGEMLGGEFGVLQLTFDIGIVNEIEAIARTLKDRRNQTIGRPQKFGWGGQCAFDYYLNFFSEYADFRYKSDKPLSSQYAKTYDVLIIHPNIKAYKLEVKTAFPSSRNLNYVKRYTTSYPRFAIAVKALDETMMRYELYGWIEGSKVKRTKYVNRYGKKCHVIPLNRNLFDYYNYFHKWILGLPYLEKFDNEHYLSTH